MLQALFYKEWIKTRRIILLLLCLMAALLVYAFINTGQAFRMGGAVQVWGNVILKDMSILPSFIQWFPLLAGSLLGWTQFIPEMTDKRLKLTLHLPLPESKILSAMLLYGTVVWLGLFACMYLVLAAGLQPYYAGEMITAMTWTMAPWLLGGILGYYFTCWICLEPVWRRRVLNTLCAIGGLSAYYLSAKSGGYSSFLPYLLLLAVAGFFFPFYSTARFKEGTQS
ncbi:MAG: hypothetical protein LBU44_00955 [Mediterranea sp.]|jgi:hypothetical protein|nr:hypothetical protein [Mediterranea sp.]